MANIQITFPSGGGVLVSPVRTRVDSGETIHWLVKSGNPTVQRVRIWFQAHPCFASPNHSQSPGEPVSQTGSAIWGIAPFVTPQRTIKYSVEGLDNAGKLVPGAGVDPDIIIDPPKPGPIITPKPL